MATPAGSCRIAGPLRRMPCARSSSSTTNPPSASCWPAPASGSASPVRGGRERRGSAREAARPGQRPRRHRAGAARRPATRRRRLQAPGGDRRPRRLALRGGDDGRGHHALRRRGDEARRRRLPGQALRPDPGGADHPRPGGAPARGGRAGAGPRAAPRGGDGGGGEAARRREVALLDTLIGRSAGHGRGLQGDRPRGDDRDDRAAHGRDRAPARSWWRAPSTPTRPGAAARSSP